MAITTVTFASEPTAVQRVGSTAVYTKRLWSDDWTLAPWLEVDEINWNTAPTLPTASLTWHYGRMSRPGPFNVWEYVSRLEGQQRYYLKIVAQIAPSGEGWSTMDWYGILDLTDDQVYGTKYVSGADLRPQGEQTFIAYGLEWLLFHHAVTRSWWTPDGSSLHSMQAGMTFNERGLANRCNAQILLNWAFASKRSDAKHWSTADIVEYLLRWHTPGGSDHYLAEGKPKFKLLADERAILPQWDKPELPAEGITTYDLLNQLIPRQRLLGWYLDVDTAPTPHEIRLRPFTYTATAIEIGYSSSNTIPANPQQLHLVFDRDNTANVHLKDTSVKSYDQVLVRGRRRTSTCTVNFSDSGFEDKSLDKGWTSEKQTAYNQAASTDGDYPASAEVYERQYRNQQARSTDELRSVFRRFVIPDTWFGKAMAGLESGDTYYADGGSTVFPRHAPHAEDPDADIAAQDSLPLNHLQLELAPHLPFLVEVDYEGDVIKYGNAIETNARPNRLELPMFVAWPLPDTDPQRWGNIEELGQNAYLEKLSDAQQHQWSADVQVIEGEPAFELHVRGAPQHIIAKNDFTPLDEDEIKGAQPDHDWREMLATVCIRDDCFCEGIYPEQPPADRSGDALRVLYLDAGASYRQDYVAVGTVVGIHPLTGALKRSSGGYVHNDVDLLTDAAKVAYQWYQGTRRILTAHTALPQALPLGAMVVQVGDSAAPANVREVNGPLTHIRYQIPRGNSVGGDAPTMTYITGSGELDPLRAIAPRSPLTQTAMLAGGGM